MNKKTDSEKAASSSSKSSQKFTMRDQLRELISETVLNTDDEVYSYYIWFRPQIPLEGNIEKLDNLFEELNLLGKNIIMPVYSDLPTLEKIDVNHCYYSWEVILSSQSRANFIRELFAGIAAGESLIIKKLGDYNIFRDVYVRNRLNKAFAQKIKLGLENVELIIQGETPEFDVQDENEMPPVENIESGSTQQPEQDQASEGEEVSQGDELEQEVSGDTVDQSEDKPESDESGDDSMDDASDDGDMEDETEETEEDQGKEENESPFKEVGGVITVKELTIFNIEALKAEIDRALANEKSVKLVATDVTEIDLSFLQLILSIRKSASQDISFSFDGDLPENIQQVLKNTGFLSILEEAIG